MAAIHRLAATGVLMFCVLGTQLSETLWAQTPSGAPENHLRLTLDKGLFTPDARVGATDAHAGPSAASVPIAPALAQRGRYYGRERHNHGHAAAIGIGAVAAIAGGAMLVYANRPACSANPGTGSCSYGMKVAGGAVLSAGLVGIVVGSVSWR